MKKTFSIFLMIMLLSCCNFVVGYAIEAPYFEDFDDYPIMEKDYGANNTSGNSFLENSQNEIALTNVRQYAIEEENGDKFLRITKINGGQVGFMNVGGVSISDLKGKLMFQFDMRATDTYGVPSIVGRYPMGTSDPQAVGYVSFTQIYDSPNYDCNVEDYNERKAVARLTKDVWYTYYMILDFSSVRKIDDVKTIMDVQLIIEDREKSGTMCNVSYAVSVPDDFKSRVNDRFRFEMKNWGELHLDNIRAYFMDQGESGDLYGNVLKHTVLKTSVSDNSLIEADNKDIIFWYTNPINTDFSDDPFVVKKVNMDGEEEIVDTSEYVLQKSLKAITISFKDNLENMSRYTIATQASNAPSILGVGLAEDLELSFEVLNSVKVTDGEFYNNTGAVTSIRNADDSTKGRVTVKSNDINDRDVFIVVALYADTDSDGTEDTMISKKITKVTAKAQGISTYDKIDIPYEGIDNNIKQKMRMFVLDTKYGIRSIGNVIDIE